MNTRKGREIEGSEKIFEETIAENLPNMGKEIVKLINSKWPYRINSKRNTPRQISLNLTKTKYRKNIKNSKGKAASKIEGKPNKVKTWSFSITLAGQKGVEVTKGKNLQPRLVYLERISFIFNREIKSITDKQNLRKLSSTECALQ